MSYQFFMYSFITLFLIVDAIGNLPIFEGFIGRFSQKHRHKIIKKSVFIAFLVLIIFTFVGEYLFQFFGIGIYSFRIAGGILLLIISIEMLFGMKTRTEISQSPEDIKSVEEDLTVTPLAVPLQTGPGAITAGIILANNASTIALKMWLCLSIVLVYTLSYIIFRYGPKIFEYLKPTGTKVIVRLMGLILAAVAVQFILAGIKEAAIALF